MSLYESKFPISSSMYKFTYDLDVNAIKKSIVYSTSKIKSKYNKYVDCLITLAVIDLSVSLDTKPMSTVVKQLIPKSKYCRISVSYDGYSSNYELYETSGNKETLLYSIRCKRYKRVQYLYCNEYENDMFSRCPVYIDFSKR